MITLNSGSNFYSIETSDTDSVGTTGTEKSSDSDVSSTSSSKVDLQKYNSMMEPVSGRAMMTRNGSFRVQTKGGDRPGTVAYYSTSQTSKVNNADGLNILTTTAKSIPSDEDNPALIHCERSHQHNSHIIHVDGDVMSDKRHAHTVHENPKTMMETLKSRGPDSYEAAMKALKNPEIVDDIGKSMGPRLTQDPLLAALMMRQPKQ